MNAIFEACSFQDLTGQRTRRAIQHLQQVEGTLTALLPGAEDPERPRLHVATQISTVDAPEGATDLAQAEIDALLNV